MGKVGKAIKYIAFILAILLTIVLIYEACMPGSVSSDHSGAVSDAVVDATEKVENSIGNSNSEDTLSTQIRMNWSEFNRYIRKGIGHFGAFLVLALFATIALYFNDTSKKGYIIISLIYGVCIATLTECLQLGAVGRYGSIDDVMLDSFGYLCGEVLCLLVALISYIVKKSKAKRKARVA